MIWCMVRMIICSWSGHMPNFTVKIRENAKNWKEQWPCLFFFRFVVSYCVFHVTNLARQLARWHVQNISLQGCFFRETSELRIFCICKYRYIFFIYSSPSYGNDSVYIYMCFYSGEICSCFLLENLDIKKVFWQNWVHSWKYGRCFSATFWICSPKVRPWLWNPFCGWENPSIYMIWMLKQKNMRFPYKKTHPHANRWMSTCCACCSFRFFLPLVVVWVRMFFQNWIWNQNDRSKSQHLVLKTTKQSSNIWFFILGNMIQHKMTRLQNTRLQNDQVP